MSDESPQPDPRADELDGNKIRQISLIRRTAYRARSYALIGGFACIVLSAQLIYLIITQLQTGGFNRYALAYALMIPLLLLGSLRCFQLAKRFLGEAQRTDQPPPSATPDFSSLGDGSQRWKDLERVE